MLKLRPDKMNVEEIFNMCCDTSMPIRFSVENSLINSYIIYAVACVAFAFRTWEQQLNNGKKRRPSLLKAIVRAFWREYLLLGVLCLINDVIIRIVQPQLLRQFLLYFEYVRLPFVGIAY